jgi:glycerol-3-phosphate O-acyltransferase
MTTTVEIPIWLLVLVLGFAAIAALDKVLVPSVRWFFRGRMERLVAQLNTRLKRPIHPFRLLGRNDMIVRLSHDPAVMQAVVDHARDTGVPESVAFQEARRYAREIVPGFSALVYFGFAIRAARWISKAFYRVQVGNVDTALDGIDPNATVVFVMNHRSNMDYVLVTWLVAGQSAISFAVGEWARIWPLSWLFRAMGAYFIRRGSRNTLYRRVLARYVQMTAAEGTTQAMFPEGGLSLDGRVGEAKLGLLGYLVAGMEPGGRDVVFVPVGIAYDRVLEDRVLVEAAAIGDRQFRARPLQMVGFLGRTIWRVIRGRFPGFGSAAVGFGAPVSLRDYMAQPGATVTGLGARLMARVTETVPLLPVPLVAAALADGPVSPAELADRLRDLSTRLQHHAGTVAPSLADPDATATTGSRNLLLRGIIEVESGQLRPASGKIQLFQFYASSIQQRLQTLMPQSDFPHTAQDVGDADRT